MFRTICGVVVVAFAAIIGIMVAALVLIAPWWVYIAVPASFVVAYHVGKFVAISSGLDDEF